jgi:23S rRNA (pseudouridine1915-N3)-methyltransferase
MQLIIAAVGHKMPAWIEAGFGEYVKRMPPECRIQLKEIKPVERSGSKTPETAMLLERARIEAVLPKGVRILALDERGKDLTSVQLSHSLMQWQQDGRDVTAWHGARTACRAVISCLVDYSKPSLSPSVRSI